MTEYIILVGLIALLVMAGVKLFGFRVDEAIQGSKNAMESRMPPDEDQPNGSQSWDVGSSTDGSGKKWNVKAFNENGKWTYRAAPAPSQPTYSSPPYNPGRHGSVPGFNP